MNGDEITQLHIKGVFNSDAVDVDYEKASPLADATVALADTHWEYTHEIEVTVDWDENDEAIKDFVTVKITIRTEVSILRASSLTTSKKTDLLQEPTRIIPGNLKKMPKGNLI